MTDEAGTRGTEYREGLVVFRKLPLGTNLHI